MRTHITDSGSLISIMRDRLRTVDNSLEIVEENNKKIAVALDNLSQARESKEKNQELYEYCKFTITLLEKEDAANKDGMIKFMEDNITVALARLFPNEEFKAKIDCEFKNRKGKASLYVIDELGNENLPDMQQGRFGQQLISHEAVSSIVRALGAPIVITDEAFSASSVSNLSIVSKIIKEDLDRGTQRIMIEQKDEIYKDLPRRVFSLYKSGGSKVSHIESVVDY